MKYCKSCKFYKHNECKNDKIVLDIINFTVIQGDDKNMNNFSGQITMEPFVDKNTIACDLYKKKD